MPGLTSAGAATVTPVEPVAIIPVVTTKNRDFELGKLEQWTYEDAKISTDALAGKYSCELKEGGYITQMLDNPAPVNSVWALECYAKRVGASGLLKVTMLHTDGSTNEILWAMTAAWAHVYFEKSEMRPEKFMSGFTIKAEEGNLRVDNVSVGIATEIITGTVEAVISVPVLKGEAFNKAVGANKDIFTSALIPTRSPTTFRIYACFDTAGVLTVRRTRGTTPPVTVSEQLNGGGNLNANAAYTFDIVVQKPSQERINLRHSAGATILYLTVTEVGGAVS